ncbi:DUF6531 domain-containing protein, partial [Streptomyces oceani]|uniref:DUF6531 domain-containing protein n=1 Tax=Streptomyces oceani TaxID=1075402 RepID=UPI0009A102B5
GQRDRSARRAAGRVRGARDAAPAKPSAVEQIASEGDQLEMQATHLAGGVTRGVSNVVSFVRSVNALDPYNLTHPGEYISNLNSTVAGVYAAARNPRATAQSMVKGFQNDPADMTGQLVPELLAGKGTGVVRGGGRMGARAGRMGRDAVESRPEGAHGSSRTPRETANGPSDPVDMATGRMYLPQRDVELPGTLPLVFTRRVESGYRAGRWFGPSWSSTIDQRLEVDAEGVVFVAEDGRLLTYPHPAVGVPTLPEAGAARMALERTRAGGYTLTDPGGELVRHFGPPEDGVDGEAWLEEITDRHGNRITFEYDPASGAPAALAHSGGYRLELTSQDGRITGLWLGGQRVRSYGYTEGQLTSVADSAGAALCFEYDDAARVTAWIDSNHRRYDYVYDNQDRCIAEGGTDGHVQLRFDYGTWDAETGTRTTTVTTPEGHQSRFVINRRCQIVAETDPNGATTHYTHDAFNRLLTHTDPLGHTTSYTRDADGHITAVTRPDGGTARASYDQRGQLVELVGPDGARWHYAYDTAGNRVRVTDPLGHETHYSYAEAGHLTSVTNALGDTTRVRCDPVGLPVEVTDPLGATTRYARDAFGRPVRITDPLGASTELEWTPEGRLVRRTDPNGAAEHWTWDGEGNRTSHTDAVGGTTHYEYTHFDLLAAHTGPDGARYEFSHDTALRLTRVTNPYGLSWDYAYDPAGHLISESDFDGRTLTYTHDQAGRLSSRTNPLGQTVTYTRDALGQIIGKDADGQHTSFAYDGAGRLTEAISPQAELLWHRDKLGRVKTELADGQPLNHTWDALGRPTSRTTPTGHTTGYTYDAAGHLDTLDAHGHALDFAYDPAGRETTRHIGPHGLTHTHTWDPAGQLTAHTLTGPDATGDVTLHRRDYTYRPDGHLAAVEDSLSGPQLFDLDPAGRPTRVRAPGWTETYAYDQAGNQSHANWPDQQPDQAARGDRTYTGTRLTTAGRTTHHHDDAGRLTRVRTPRPSRKAATWDYTYNAEDQLTDAVTPDGTHWRYTYDALGRRTTKQRLGASGEIAEEVRFTWDGPTLIEQTSEGAGLPHPVTLTWNHRGHTPLAQTERRLASSTDQREIDARFFAIVTDLVGTPTHLVDESGRIAWHTRTTLWGTTTWNQDATAYTPLRFPGQYHDPETGLHYNLHRYYDATTARYTTPDPLGLAPSPNHYAYVGNPHTWTDPLGLAPGCQDKGGWYGQMQPAGPGNEINHIPAKSAYKHLSDPRLTEHMGPAVRMEYQDHRDVTSTGSSREAKSWQAEQRALIDQGKFDEAMKMDIDDIRSRYGGKYDVGIQQMVDSLKSNGGLQSMLSANGWTINYDLLK